AGAGLAGVADEVEEDLADFAGEGFDDDVAEDADVEGDFAAAEDGVEKEADAFRGGAEVDALGGAGLAEEGERGTRDGEDTIGFLRGHAREARDLGCGDLGLTDEVEDVLDGLERVADLVSDDGGHAAPVFELLGGHEALLHLRLFVFSAGEALGVVVDAEADGFEAADELKRDVGGECGGEDVGPGVDPEGRRPGGDDLHEMRGTAGDDEESEAGEKEYPVARNTDPCTARERKQREADGGVAEEGDRV